MPSLMEALEARRAEVLGQAERLREQIAGLSAELSRAEERLARLQIARETALSRWLIGWDDLRVDQAGGGCPWGSCRRRTG
ncbi:hypothetical protein ACFWD7_54115, partial [Streptomyces mirabilis]|uniref:hypothetical protein n=1 Tax=Streptomyces mirabilis TaxID=68239 RepID=UPI0036BAAD00